MPVKKYTGELVDLGRLRHPRRTNARAFARIAAGEALWDRRAVNRRAEKKRLARQSTQAQGSHQLVKAHRLAVLAQAPSWAYDGEAFTPASSALSPLQLVEQLIHVLEITAQLADPDRRVVPIRLGRAAQPLMTGGIDLRALQRELRATTGVAYSLALLR